MYDEGWEVLRETRYARQVEMGLLDPKIHPLPAIDRGNRSLWNEMSDEQRAARLGKAGNACRDDRSA